MSFSTDIFKANEKPVTFVTQSFVDGFDTHGGTASFTLDGLVSQSGGSAPSGNSDNAQTVQARAFFPDDARLRKLRPSATAVIDGKEYKVVEVDPRLSAPTGYSVTVHLSREVS